MTKDQIENGVIYWVRHTGVPTKVKVIDRMDLPRVPKYNHRASTRWLCLNLTTGREITIKSAMKFLKPAVQQDITSTS